MPTRVNNLNTIFKALAVVVLLVGGIVGVLIALDVFGGDELVPEIESIGTSQENASDSAEVIPGQEIEVTGKNLDLISKIFLKGLLGQSPIPVLLTPVSNTRLVITVPDSTQFGDYDIEFEDSDGDLIAVLQLMVVSEIEFARGPGRPTPTPGTGTANPQPTNTAGTTPSSTNTTATGPSPTGSVATKSSATNTASTGTPQSTNTATTGTPQPTNAAITGTPQPTNTATTGTPQSTTTATTGTPQPTPTTSTGTPSPTPTASTTGTPQPTPTATTTGTPQPTPTATATPPPTSAPTSTPPLTVTPTPALGHCAFIDFLVGSLILKVSETLSLTVVVKDSAGTVVNDCVLFPSSDNPGIAIVSPASPTTTSSIDVTGVASGGTIIKVTLQDGGAFDTLTVDVQN